MKVLIITQYFPPETGAAASRWGDFSEILVDQNNFVTVLCETPHYPNDYYYLNYTNKWKSIEKKNEKLTVIRSKAFASNRSNSVKKIIHYLVFMLSAITNLHKIKSFDLIIISSPPLFTGVIGIFIKKIYRKEFWLDIRDLWPDSVLELSQISTT